VGFQFGVGSRHNTKRKYNTSNQARKEHLERSLNERDEIQSSKRSGGQRK